MDEHERELTRQWVQRWAKVGPELEAIRRRELREMTYEERVRVNDALLQIGCQFSRHRTSSGMVEQQRLFQRATQ